MNRFKKWLIRKLGGYTDPWERQAFEIVTTRVEPITLRASIMSYTPYPDLEEPDVNEQKVICSMLAEKIMHDKLFTRVHNPYNEREQSQLIDYTVRVVPPPGYISPTDNLFSPGKEGF